MNNYSTGFETLRLLQMHFLQGNLTKEDFEKRRVAIVDAMTGTVYQIEEAPPELEVARLEKLGTQGVTDDHHVNYQFITARLPKGQEAIKDRFELAKNDPAFQKKDGQVEIRDWEIFHAAANNNVKRLGELVDYGISLELKDTDSGATPLILAASRSQRQSLMWLVEHGANVNAQNNRGMTALHMLVQSKQTILAIWIVKQGADPFLEDSRHFSAYDIALPWMQNELKEAWDYYNLSRRGALPIQSISVPSAPAHSTLSTPMSSLGSSSSSVPTHHYEMPLNELLPTGGAAPASPTDHSKSLPPLGNPTAPASTGATKVMRIYLKNNAYKAVQVTDAMKAGDLCAIMAEKLGMPEYANSLEVIDCIKTTERRIDPNMNIFRLTGSWPVLISTSAEPSLEQQCRLKVVPLRGCSEVVNQKYRAAMYGK